MSLAILLLIFISTTYAQNNGSKEALISMGKTNDSLSMGAAQEYLIQYGYMNKSLGNNTDNAILSISQELMEFQERYDLPIDGTLNQQTANLMQSARCGVRDIENYMIYPLKWPSTNLMWNIFPPNFDSYVYKYRKVAELAFKQWERVSHLRFTYTPYDNANITITFNDEIHLLRNKGHNCSSKLDFPTLGHAFYPDGTENVEIHINNGIRWNFGTTSATTNVQYNLLGVLTHEVGHALGIGHSIDPSAIMYPYITKRNNLSDDDIFAIQRLYGNNNLHSTTTAKTIPTTVRTTTTKKPITTTTRKPLISTTTKEPFQAAPSLCDLNFKILDTFLVVKNKLYIFYEKYVWMYNLNTREISDVPILLTDYLLFLPKDFKKITAIYERPNGQIALISDETIYTFEYGTFKLIHIENVDMLSRTNTKTVIHAIVNSNKARTYLFVNNFIVWTMDECSFRPKETHLISELFKGIPAQIDGVFRYTNGRLYFIQKDIYFEYDEFTDSLISTGKMDLNFFGIKCPNVGLLEQLKLLLGNIISNNVKIIDK